MENILITGGSSGVGSELAKYLSKTYNVIVLARRKEKMKNNFLNYNNILCFEVDLFNQENLDCIMDEILEKTGPIYYLINNAGVLIKSSIEEMRYEDFEYSSIINAISPIRIINKLLPAMKKKNFGRIINITSGAPLNCSENVGLYSSTKALLNVFTVTLSKELKDFNIKVNLMSPGPVKSEMAPQSKLEPSVCFDTVDYLLNIDEKKEDGKFYWLGYEIPLFPELGDIQWLEGIGSDNLKKIL